MSWRHSGQVRRGWEHSWQQQTWPQLRKIIWAWGLGGEWGRQGPTPAGALAPSFPPKRGDSMVVRLHFPSITGSHRPL